MISNGTTVAKYTVNSNGTLTTATLTLSGLVQPQSVSVSYDGSTVVVCDGGSAQQVKAFSNSTGVSSWTLGTAGGYNNSPSVTNTKFYFSDLRGNYPCSITYNTDGSFWVVDYGNSRMLHFSSSRTYIEQVAYLGRSYSSGLCGNDSSRVFSDYLEYAVDYTNPIQQAWTLKNNWGYNIPANVDNQYTRFKNVQTLSNGRTYAILLNTTTNLLQPVELTDSLRFIGDLSAYSTGYALHSDGSLRRTAVSGGVLSFLKRTLTGFSSNNPTWSSESTEASTSQTDSTQPVFGGARIYPYEVLPNNTIVSFAGNATLTGYSADYHLGGLKIGETTWAWETARSTALTYAGNFPADGNFDRGNGSQYQGNLARVIDSLLLWGYNGEFWKNSQTNMYNMFSQDGLFLYQFGRVGTEGGVYGYEAPAGMAGNGFGWSIVKVNGHYYLYHNDESYHSGVHRWRIDNITSIKVQNIAAKIYTAPVTNTIDLMTDVPASGTFTSTGNWTRFPNTESNTSTDKWTMTAGTKSYGKSKDILINYQKVATDHYLQYDFGSITSSAWTLSGNLSYTFGNNPNDAGAGDYFDILDAGSKVIARLYLSQNYTNHYYTIYANGDTLASDTSAIMGKDVGFERPLQISVNASGVTFSYHDFPVITVPLQDATADWQHPKYLNINFFDTNTSPFRNRTLDIQNFKLTY
jgi:hypothetical protein